MLSMRTPAARRPAFEPLESRVLLSATDTSLGLTSFVSTGDASTPSVNASLSSDHVAWTWSGSMAIPDGPSGAWVGVDCLPAGSLPAGVTVTRVVVHEVITHPYIGDVQVELYDGAHTWIVRSNEGGNGTTINDTRTDTTTFISDAADQEWSLRVRDTALLDAGTLTGLEVDVYYSTPANTAPILSSLPDITINENTTFPSSSTGTQPTAGQNAMKLGADDVSLVAAASSPLGDATPAGAMFRSDLTFGGTWWDANKTLSNTDDDLMCWAAAASNMLEWTGWGSVAGLTSSQQIFQYLNAHWTDQGGMMEYAWDWWFSGANPSAGWSGWSQVEAAGGDFWPSNSISNYFHDQETPSQAMTSIDQWTRAGYGVTIGLYGVGGHAITVWGFNYDPSNPTNYYGIWVTDSDDDKSSDSPADRLRYYDVSLSGGKWYLQNFYGSNSWYIGSVEALDRKPGGTTEPSQVDLWQYASDAETSSGQLTYTIVGNTNPSCGVSISGNRWIVVSPTHNWSGVSTVTVQVSDGQYTSTDTFRVTVVAVNQPPTISGLPDQTLPENTKNPSAVYLPSYASDPETASPSLTYTIIGNTNPSCGVSIVSGAYLSLAPTAGWIGYSDITIQVTDGQYTSTDTFRVTVTAPTVSLSGTLSPLYVPDPTGPLGYNLVQLQVRNTGNATASSLATMQLWASGDGVLGGADDFKLAEIRPYVYLTAGSTGTYYFSYVLAGNIPAGTYSLVATIDVSGDILKSNTSAAQTSIADSLVVQNPDLTISIPVVVLPLTTPGSWVVTVLKVDNAGSAWTYGQSDIQVWASTDGILGNGTGDTLLSTLHNYWIVLPPHVSGYYVAVFQLPSSLVSGEYSIMAVINPTGSIAETSLANNTGTYKTTYSLGVQKAAAAPLGQVAQVSATRASAQSSESPAAVSDPEPISVSSSASGAVTPAESGVSVASSSPSGYDGHVASPTTTGAPERSGHRLLAVFGHAVKSPFESLVGLNVL